MSFAVRALSAFLLAAIALVVSAGPASAHAGATAESSNFKTTISAVVPALSHVSISVKEGGDRMQLTNKGSEDAIIAGYSNEPYLKVTKDGVWQNRLSPAVYMNEDRYGDRAPPAFANAAAPPEWQKISRRNVAIWHDHHAHWMSREAPASVKEDPSRTYKVMPNFAIPVTYGSTTATVRGDVEWIPPQAHTTWLGLSLVAALVVAVGAIFSRTRALGLGLIVIVVSDFVHVVGGFLAGVGSAGTRLTAFVTQDSTSVVAWFTGAWAVYALTKGRKEVAGFAGLFTAAVLWIFGGVTDMSTLWNSQITFGWPQPLARAAVATTLGAGVSTLVLSGRLIRESTARTLLTQGSADDGNASPPQRKTPAKPIRPRRTTPPESWLPATRRLTKAAIRQPSPHQ